MFTKFKSLFDDEINSDAGNETCFEHKQPPKIIEFSINETRKILRGKCLSHLDNCIIYNGMDIETGELYTIKEWIVYDIDDAQGQNILGHLSLLVHLRHHNLAKLENYTYEYVAAENKWIFYILQEFIYGANCLLLFLTKKFPIQSDLLRQIAIGILNSLDFLDRSGIMCLNLMDASICLDNNGDIKLVNYEINDIFTNSTPTQLKFNNDNVYNFGILLLSLMRGEVVKSTDAEIPKAIPSSLQDFLVRCRTNDTEEQVTVAELLKHSFIQTSCDFLNCAEVPETQEILCRPEVLERPQSRVELDFKILDLLGEGGFGKVYKAQKILDEQIYALKKIKLNLNNEKLNNKLIREVYVLSKLNHENIVRYYNSWTDVENIKDSDEETDTSDSEDFKAVQYDTDEKQSTGSIDYEEYLYMESPNSGLNDYYEDCDIVNDSVVDFKANIEDENGANSKDSATLAEDNMALEYTGREFLYIQMEFCKGETLQTVIESNELHWDINRIWKFLREIVEGLVHIHQQGIIHRDLKPMNIFLDSNDHVKIGDFGLATTNIRYKGAILDKNKQNSEHATALNKMENGSSTSQVGTGLYKAPELSSMVCIGDQKLDMYSLGIILFEMCYKRPNTYSERITVLMNLRQKEIFPKDFDCILHSKPQAIIRKLLNHNPLERPTSRELLENERIPPILEEKKQQEMFRHVIDNPHFKLYKYLMERCFNQTSNYYENDYHSFMFGYRNISKLDSVANTIAKVFRLHGAQNLRMSAVMPQNSCYDDCQFCVKLMTRLGSLVSIPCNSRMPFARYVATNKNLQWLRRYSIEKIKTPTRLAEEAYECAFDIVTPITFQNFLPDAEILTVLNEIKDSFPDLHPNSFRINLNHSLLIKAIFLECGIEDSHPHYAIIVKVLKCLKDLLSKTCYLRNYLSEDAALKVAKLTDLTLSCAVRNTKILKLFTEIKARNMAKTALQELNNIVKTAEMLGATCPMGITFGLMHNFEKHSGMLVEFVYDLKNKGYVLAAGGRYDGIIEKFQGSACTSEHGHLLKYGVGISVHLENLCELLQLKKCGKSSDVVVCSFSEKAVLNEKVEILRELWSAGISSSFVNVAAKIHLANFCKKYNIPWAILLTTEDVDKGLVTLVEWKRRWSICKERKMNIQKVIAILKYPRSCEQVYSSPPVTTKIRKRVKRSTGRAVPIKVLNAVSSESQCTWEHQKKFNSNIRP